MSLTAAAASSIGAAGISAGAGMASSALQAASGKRAIKRQFQAQFTSNILNSLYGYRAQVAGMKSAGLNPAMMYGGGSGGNLQTAQAIQSPVNKYEQMFQGIGNMINSAVDVKLKNQQAEKTKEEIQLVKGRVDQISADMTLTLQKVMESENYVKLQNFQKEKLRTETQMIKKHFEIVSTQLGILQNQSYISSKKKELINAQLPVLEQELKNNMRALRAAEGFQEYDQYLKRVNNTATAMQKLLSLVSPAGRALGGLSGIIGD